MKTFEFSIVATGLDPQADDFENRFYDAGCDDALVSFQKGHIIIDFAREAKDLIAAISSAQADVEKAGAKIVRVEPDPLVSLSDIAARSDCTRAAISLYAKGLRGQDFPAPIARVTSESPLWNWTDVSKWMFLRGKIDQIVAIEAFVFEEANVVISKPAAERDHILRHRMEECWHVAA
nr:hypothetical protein [Ochrobactrum sp. UNC390CL2Tsu3S39]